MGIRTGVAPGKKLAKRLTMSDSRARAVAWLGTETPQSLGVGAGESPFFPTRRSIQNNPPRVHGGQSAQRAGMTHEILLSNSSPTAFFVNVHRRESSGCPAHADQIPSGLETSR